MLNDEVTHISFDSALQLSVDQAIKAYIETFPENVRPLSADNQFYIGSLSIRLSIGLEFAELAIYAVSSSQNKVLAESEVLHQHIMRILNQCDGLSLLMSEQRAWRQH